MHHMKHSLRAAVFGVTWVMYFVGTGPTAGPALCSVCVSTGDKACTHTHLRTVKHMHLACWLA